MNTQVNTSAEAYESIKPKVLSIREQIYNEVSQYPEGVIAEEVFNTFSNLGFQSVERRFTELKKLGRIKAATDENGTVKVRRNTRGRNQQVFVVA